MQVRVGPQRVGEQVGDERRPEVLVLDVDQAARPREDFAVGVGDAAFAERGEGVPAQPGRVGAQDLDGVGARARRVGQLGGQVAADEFAGVIGPVDQHP